MKAAQQQLDAARKAAQAAAQPVTPIEGETEPADDTTGETEATPTVEPPAAPVIASDVTAAEQALQQARADREMGLLAYRQQLEAARAAYQQARAGQKMNHIRAPISGMVVALNAQPGAQVGENKTPVATIVALDALQVHAPMSSDEAGYVKPGKEVVLRFEGVPDKQFTGKVERITSEAARDADTVKPAQFVAILSFKNDAGMIKPQAEADVSVKIGEVKDVLVVPVAAVEKDESGRPYVFALSNGNWNKAVVETGMSDGKYIQIKSGLQQGQTVQVQESIAQKTARL